MSMHDEFIGAGLATKYIDCMKLQGWLPIHEYFDIRNRGTDLDWVLVLTMEDNGYIAIPCIAEYCTCENSDPSRAGWYLYTLKDDVVRLDDFTNVIMFKIIDSNDGLEEAERLLLKYLELENIQDEKSYRDSFFQQVIKTCKSNSKLKR